MKKKIAIISSSVREGRLSHRVALFYKDYLGRRDDVEPEIIDLLEYDFPLFNERLPYMKAPAANLLDYARRIRESDAIVVVSPVYNAGYPAALKNAIDVLVGEWSAKPVMVASVSAGSTPGITTALLLQALLIRMNARIVSSAHNVTHAAATFTPEGVPTDPETAERYAKASVDELMWLAEKSCTDKK